MKPELVVFSDARELGRALAGEIADGIESAGADGRRYLLGCPGGRSPRTTYEALVEVVAERKIALSHLTIVMMDDYVVQDDDGVFAAVSPEAHFSVARFAHDVIVNPLNAAAPSGGGIHPDNVWFPNPAAPEVYDQQILDAGGVDLFILASGDSDGHVAFNPPGTDPESRTRIIALADTTRTDNLGTFPDFESLADVPRHGISVGIATIRELSRRVVLVAPGQAKKMAVRRISAASHYETDWPATVLSDCRRPTLYADATATSESDVQ
jgi:glucosamine-6-phosphate deaminase